MAKANETQAASLKLEHENLQRQKIKEVEDENLIIMEGLKQEYEERIKEL